MKNINKLSAIAIILLGIVMATNTIAQTNNYVPKWSSTSSSYVNTATPVFEDATNLRIGIGTITPAYKLDVSGDLNIASANAYRISTNPVLWYNTHTSDILVGVGAGNSTMTGHSNTMVGNSAGTSITRGDSLTFVGFQTGYHNTTGWNNTAIGYQALYSNDSLIFNTAVGFQALYTNSSCGDCFSGTYATNTAVGYQALYSSQAYGGCALGFQAAYSSTTGCSNIAIGEGALKYTTTGGYNVAIGASAAVYNVTGVWNVCIGDHAGGGASGNSFSNNSLIGYRAGYSLLTDSDNVMLGCQAGYYNQTGVYNTVSGYQAGYGVSNDSYTDNDYYGYQAGFATQTNEYNVCLGMESGQNNTASYETFVGHTAGQANTSGEYNSFLGYGCGLRNTTANDNSLFGSNAGPKITTGSDNSGFGYHTLQNDTTGQLNTAVGSSAGVTIITGDSDVFVGAAADANGSAYNNCAAYGYGTKATASDKFDFGNTNVIGCYNSSGVWGSYSDGRFKINVQNENIGLDFINKLRPVTYNMDTKALDAFINYNRPQTITDSSGNTTNVPQGDFSASTGIVHSGFIAQEVDSVSKACGFTSSIVSEPSNSHDPYALNYAEFVVPLVKAVQQLDSINKGLAAKMQTQDSVINNLQSQISQCCSNQQGSLQDRSINNNNNSGSSTNGGSIANTQQVELNSLGSNIVLYQNEPNPFGENTVIRYFVPQNMTNVQVVFYDEFGRELSKVPVQQTGYGSLQISSANLASGIYSYSIVSDGQVIDTKRMVRTK